MATAPALERYLRQSGASYDVMAHSPTMSSMRTAAASHIPADHLAKAVVLKDGDAYLLAVLPASHQLQIPEVEATLNRRVALAAEDEIAGLFPDCAPGAVPPLGAAYGLPTIVDDSITQVSDVYFEGGDHETLVHMDGPSFGRLLAGAPHGRFSRHD